MLYNPQLPASLGYEFPRSQPMAGVRDGKGYFELMHLSHYRHRRSDVQRADDPLMNSAKS